MIRVGMLERAQQAVHDFHKAFGIKVGDLASPKLDCEQLRRDLIYEEYDEFREAIEKGDLPEAIDALCDIIYVCLGAAVTFGVDLEPFFVAVHESNMKKAGGYRREDGKWMKPEGWQPPDIAGILKYQVDTIAEVRQRMDAAEEALKNR